MTRWHVVCHDCTFEGVTTTGNALDAVDAHEDTHDIEARRW